MRFTHNPNANVISKFRKAMCSERVLTDSHSTKREGLPRVCVCVAVSFNKPRACMILQRQNQQQVSTQRQGSRRALSDGPLLTLQFLQVRCLGRGRCKGNSRALGLRVWGVGMWARNPAEGRDGPAKGFLSVRERLAAS